ncbi:ferrous iron transport protein B [Miniphocaeibacter massiliensis]|uniref:ferrous iron transport protein B n=1 Tax=Miniphocaeibacter massiliensis TaxID=2041841 RepID=UPI000C069ED0|nr:ferrous iron transport protein B [Miniphocaeibacter massiliensis]
MSITIALAGNPNSGKTTLFNLLTGSSQYVGNWPGVTVERKEGLYKKEQDIRIVDLPGIYSLSPYTLEEVVSRDYLINEKPDVIINIIDATNLERNLYLTTQLIELGLPVVVALNMMDLVDKTGEKILTDELEDHLGCKVVKISALRKTGIEELIDTCKKEKDRKVVIKEEYSAELEKFITSTEEVSSKIKNSIASRFLAIKLLENDEKIFEKLNLDSSELSKVKEITERMENEFDDDGEGIITDARYTFVSKITKHIVKNKRAGLTTSDKIDRVVTNRFLAIPIFAVFMFAIYYISIKVGNDIVGEWVNGTLIEGIIQGGATNLLEGWGVADWLISLVVDGIIGGVGGVIGFLPVIAFLYFFIAILEDIGYMSRIAFILDRVLRKFGLSGKSFIPILIGMGCSIPGIMATRTIESDKDRRLTIMVASFMPCGAKTDIIALFAGAIFVGKWWFAPICYFAGILAVIISGVILKKTKAFIGEAAPFVMELPAYHMPILSNILRTTWQRLKAFIIKAGTIILLSSIVIWLLSNISTTGKFVEFSDDSHSILEAIGRFIAPIFAPLGFGDWTATVASIMGLVAKEMVVGTYGVVSGLGELGADDPTLLEFAAKSFTTVTAMSFMMFNQLTVPCFAAVGAIRSEMKSAKWTLATIAYQVLFSYTIALMIYQFGRILILGEALNIWTGVAIVILLVYLFLLFRASKKRELTGKL